MKSIEEISTEVTEQIMFNERHINFVEIGKTIAKKAILEILKFIPVEDEIPPTKEFSIFSDNCICLAEGYLEPVSAYYDSESNMWKDYNSDSILTVTHWRPIYFL